MPVDGQKLIRSAKSASDWTKNELLAYNIQVSSQEAPQFFGREQLGPIDDLDVNLLSTIDPTLAPDFTKETYRFLAYLDLASHSHVGQESAIEDFAKTVLEVTGYDTELGTILRTRYDIPFTICGEVSVAKPDVCLVHLNSMILLVVQADKANQNLQSPEAQVIAEAIAAFQHNNEKRRNRHLPPLDSMNIPCITMAGTRPCFYKVPVTKELSDAVISGQYPK